MKIKRSIAIFMMNGSTIAIHNEKEIRRFLHWYENEEDKTFSFIHSDDGRYSNGHTFEREIRYTVPRRHISHYCYEKETIK